MDDKHQLELADAQLLGYLHGKHGYSLTQLIDSMGLTLDEWQKLKSGYIGGYLLPSEEQEIERYLKKSERGVR